MRRIKSNMALQDVIYRGVHGQNRDASIPAQPRDAKMIQSIASLIRAKSKLLLLENPDMVEIYKLDDRTAGFGKPRKEDLYLPAIKTSRAPSLNSVRGTLSQSCPYLYDKRRGSFSSVASHRTAGPTVQQQSYVRIKKEAKKSNVTVTMTYLGRGRRGPDSEFTPDELKVLQQVSGGENICVFKSFITPGERFQFVSQRHIGFPFSASLYINGIMATRISSCCEYRYAPGFQQGRKSCFKLIWLAGGMPCYRCRSLRNQYGSIPQLDKKAEDNLTLPSCQNTRNGPVESCPSSPLFIPAKPVKKRARGTRKLSTREGTGTSTDSEDPAVTASRERTERKRRKGQSNQRESIDKAAGRGRREPGQGGNEFVRSAVAEKCEEGTRGEGKQRRPSGNDAASQTKETSANKTVKSSVSLQEREEPTEKNTKRQIEVDSDGKNRNEDILRDFYAECVEMSAALQQGPNKQQFKASILERCRLQKKLSSHPKAAGSDVELSAESDDHKQPDAEEEKTEEDEQEEEEVPESLSKKEEKEEPAEEQDLEAQLDAMMSVLRRSDEVEQLVLRNTGLTDDMLLSLAGVLKSSPSQVSMLNLNLNLIGPYGAHILLDLLRVKPQIRGLHLFGNKLRDHGVLTLLSGIAELQEQTAAAAASIQHALLYQSQQDGTLHLPAEWSSFEVFSLQELDVGGNGLNSDGVRVLASYVRSHSHLRYLGLAQTRGADLSAWKELFDSLRWSGSLTHVILDENNLGDPGVRLLAELLRDSESLRQVDLDVNGISDVGGNDIMAALLGRAHAPLSYLSLQENDISAGLMSRIQEQVETSCASGGAQ